MSRFARVFSVLICFSSLTLASQPDTTLLARIDALATSEANAGLLSGAMLVARGDRVLLQREYGYASWELRAPITHGTRFGIGSITKVMTEMVVEMLTAEGRLDLDAPASRYLGSFPAGPKGGVVTIRHLVDHRSGVPHRVTTGMEEMLPLRPADIVDRVRARGLVFEPGAQELYSSAGFSSLARVIEVIESKPFDAVLGDRIFRPASMSATGETGQQLMPQRALPHRLAPGAGAVVVASAQYKNLGFLTGAGSLYATAEDLLRFSRALRTGVFGSAGKRRVEETASQTWRGWYGRTDGYEASVDVLPTEDLTFIFLSNLRSGANWQLREQIRNLLAGRNAAPISRPPAPLEAAWDPPESFVGSYGDASDPVVIGVADGHLFRDENEFYPVAGGRYCIPASNSVFRFRRGADGSVDAMVTKSPWADEERVLVKLPRRE
jgi:CubicO group peptidase (beta-lactamase class C family)